MMYHQPSAVPLEFCGHSPSRNKRTTTILSCILVLFIQTKRRMEYKGRNGNYAPTFCNYTRHTAPGARCEPETSHTTASNRQVLRKGKRISKFSRRCLDNSITKCASLQVPRFYLCVNERRSHYLKLHSVEWEDRWMMKQNGLGRKWSWSNGGMSPAFPWRDKENLIQCSPRVPTENRAHNLPNTRQEHYR
jgi:hypothetical protein